MAHSPANIDPTLLADQSTWVLSLARSLVRDPTGADDVAQETLLAGLAAPPQDANDPRRLRAWLGRVVFNLAHLSTRRNIRRRAREQEVARPERQASAADTAIQRSVMRQVGKAVDELREPYRSVVIMRYFEGLSTAAIAAATKTSESAVRKRLWRARGQLRQGLELQHNGERAAWFQGAFPFLGLTWSRRPEAGLGLHSAALGATLLAAAASVMLLLAPWSSGPGSAESAQANPRESVGLAGPAKVGRSGHQGAAAEPRSPTFLGYLRVDPLEDE